MEYSRKDGYPGETDGKLYSLGDMVKAGCGDCQGCWDCCRGMGQSIVLNPLDISLLVKNLETSFETLLKDKIELKVEEGLILPCLKMRQEDEACVFLNGEGRCAIHPFRTGICRRFPLCRRYQNNSLQYILLVNGCTKENRTKVKVKKWIDTLNVQENEKFLTAWHYFCRGLEERIQKEADEKLAKAVSMYVLKRFYLETCPEPEDFYDWFWPRLREGEKEWLETQKMD